MDLVKTISALGFAITMLSFAVMLGRILQGLDDLKKVDVSLDPEKGTVKELRERTHERAYDPRPHPQGDGLTPRAHETRHDQRSVVLPGDLC